jgi:hypothetical protein
MHRSETIFINSQHEKGDMANECLYLVEGMNDEA